MNVIVIILSILLNGLLVTSVISITMLIGNYSEYFFSIIALLYAGNMSLAQGVESKNSEYVDLVARIGVARTRIYRAIGELVVLIVSLITALLFRNNLIVYFACHVFIIILTLIRAPQLIIYLNAIVTKRLNINQ